MESHPADGPTCILKVSTCCLGGFRLLSLHFTKLWPPKFIKKKKVITCCKGCATKIKKKLQKIKGVNSITIDYEKGMVAVSGEVDPATILVTISKLKIMTELVSYKKDPHDALNKKQAQRLKKTQNHHPKAKDTKKIAHDDDDHHHHSNSHTVSNSDSDDGIDEGHHDHSAHKIRKPANMKGQFLAPHGKGYFPKSRPEFPLPRPYGPQNHWAPGMYGRPPPPPALPLPPRPPRPPMPPHAYGYDYHLSTVPRPRPPPHMYPYPYYHRPKQPQVGNSMLHYFSDDNTATNCTIM